MEYHWTEALRRDRIGVADASRIDAAMDCPPCRQQPEGSTGGSFPTQQMGQSSFDGPQVAQRG